MALPGLVSWDHQGALQGGEGGDAFTGLENPSLLQVTTELSPADAHSVPHDQVEMRVLLWGATAEIPAVYDLHSMGMIARGRWPHHPRKSACVPLTKNMKNTITLIGWLGLPTLTILKQRFASSYHSPPTIRTQVHH